METDIQSIRLEVLKLVYRHDRAPEDSVKAAEILERYVVGSETSGRKFQIGKGR